MAKKARKTIVRRFDIKKTLKWWSSGWRFFKRNPVVWTAAAFVFVLFTLTVGQIPILGEIIVLGVTPIVYASAMMLIAQLTAPAASAGEQAARLREAKKKNTGQLIGDALIGAVKVRENIVPLLVFSAFLMVIGVVGQIISHLIAGPVLPVLSGLLDIGSASIPRVLGAKLTLLAIHILMALVLFYSIPFLVVDNRILPRALKWGIRGALANAPSLAVLMLTFIAPLIIVSLIFPVSDIRGFAATLVIGTGLAAVFVNSCYCGFKLTFQRQ